MTLRIFNGLLVDIHIYHPSQTTLHVNPDTGEKRDILNKWLVPPVFTFPTSGGCLKAASKTVPYLERVRKEIPNLGTREFDYDDVSFFREISQRLDEFADNTTEKDYGKN